MNKDTNNAGALPDGTGFRADAPSPAVSALRASIPSADVAAIWRNGVGCGVEAADRVMARMYKSRSKAVREFAKLLDDINQMVADESRKPIEINRYQDAFALTKAMQIKVTQAIEARSDETRQGFGPQDESAVAKPCAERSSS